MIVKYFFINMHYERRTIAQGQTTQFALFIFWYLSELMRVFQFLDNSSFIENIHVKLIRLRQHS